MRVKTRLVEDVPQPDLKVGLRCVRCQSYVLNLLSLSRITPRVLWSKAREKLEPLDGKTMDVAGTFYCRDCAPEEDTEPGEGDTDGRPEDGERSREVEAGSGGGGERPARPDPEGNGTPPEDGDG